MIQPSAGGGGIAPWLRAVGLPLVITAICLRGLALPGFVLQVDSAFGPHTPPAALGFPAPVALITVALGGLVAGRVWLCTALFLCGFGPMVLLRRSHWLVQILGGLLGALNPFVFGRLVEGQWGVAASAGVLFLWLAAWEWLRESPGFRRSLTCAALGVFAVVFDQHAVGLLALLAVSSLLWWRAWQRPDLMVWAAASFAMLGCLMLYGIIPFFLGHGSDSYGAVQSFSKADLSEFRAASSRHYGLWLNLLDLFGFWPERLGRIPLLRAGAPWWPATALVLAGAAVAGSWLKRERAWLLAAGVFGLLVAGSTATAVGFKAFAWLAVHVPLAAAYREPEKWSALWLLALVVLGAETASFLLEGSSRWGPGLATAGGLTLALIGLAILLPNGISAVRELPATVVPVQYPDSWTSAAAYLKNQAPPKAKVAVLPFELYVPLAFAGHRLTANPARVLIENDLIAPTDPQIPGAADQQGPDGIARASLQPRARSCQLAGILDRLGAGWVLIEPTGPGPQDMRQLLDCGFTRRMGSLSEGPVVLSR